MPSVCTSATGLKSVSLTGFDYAGDHTTVASHCLVGFSILGFFGPNPQSSYQREPTNSRI